jgi:MFS family permease
MGITAENESRLFGAMNGDFQGAGVLCCLTTPWVSDKYGRKMILYVGAFFNVLSAGLLAGSVNITMFLVARFIAGAGAFMLLGSVPVRHSFCCFLNVVDFFWVAMDV